MQYRSDFQIRDALAGIFPGLLGKEAMYFIVMMGFFAAQAVHAQTAISEAIAAYAGGSESSYTEGGTTYNFGVVPSGESGNELVVTSFEIDLGLGDGVEPFAITRFADRISIVRQDNEQVSGNKQLMFYEDAGSSGSEFNLRPSFINTMEEVLLNQVINRGTDNVFANQGGTNLNNIERIDFIVDAGLIVPADTAGDGFVILERGGNDDFKIAAITSLDANGVPDAFGPVVSVSASDWGASQWFFVTQVLASDTPADNLVRTDTVGTQTISGVYLSYADLGASENDVIFGYSLAGGDVTDVSADWVDTSVEANFPRDTSAASNDAGGLDLVAGGSIASRSPLADLAVTKTVDDETPVVGENVTFTITVENLGPFSTINTQVTDVLPSGYTFVSSNASRGSYDASTGFWDIGGMLANETQTLEITVTVEPFGDYLNIATVTGCCSDPDLSNNTDSASVTPTSPTSDLSILKTSDGDGLVNHGDTITYTIVIANTGDSAVSGVNVEDVLPAGVTYVPGSVSATLDPAPGTGGSFTEVITSAGSGTFTVPAGVTALTVEAWGSGGGGAASGSNDAGGGGGGGAFARIDSLAVTPGQVIDFVVGAGAGNPGAGNPGQPGQASWFLAPSTLLAQGGGGGGVGSISAGGAGGSAASSVGDVRWSGGNGGAGLDSNPPAQRGGGGGGGSAFATEDGGNGGDGAQNAPGAGGLGTGNGGAGGQATVTAGEPGSAPGGGGGGCSGAGAGGGGDGRLVISYGISSEGTIGAPPELATGWTLDPGATLTITFEVTLDTDAVLTHITNVALFTSDDDPTPIADSVTDQVNGATIGSFVWIDANGSGLQDAGEPGLAGVTVALLNSSGDPVVDPAGTAVTATTDAFGAYSFAGLPAGDYQVEFSLPGNYVFTTQDADGQGLDGMVNSDADPATGRTPVFSLAAGETNNNIDAGAYIPGSISGLVELDATGNAEGDGPQGGVTVGLLDSNGNTVATAVTDSNGAYLFNDVVPGDYTVVQTVPSGFGAVNDQDGGDLTINGDQTPISVTSGDVITGQDFVNRELLDYGDAPESYRTLAADNGPRHRVGGPWMPNIANVIGSPGVNDTTAAVDAVPDEEADSDAAEEGVILADLRDSTSNGGVTCDGLFLENTEDTFFYCAAVRVANPTSDIARLVGWVDFGGTGEFGPIDRSSPTLLRGTSGFAGLDGDCQGVGSVSGDELDAGDWGIPANCEGVVVVVWEYGPGDTLTTGQTFARFRISTDTSNDFDTDPSPLGFLADGEVEDHLMDAGTIPVSIHAFESTFVRGGLQVTWSTASETHNKGFYIWGETSDGGFELLTPDMIPSEASGAVQPQSYSVVIPGIGRGQVRDLIISAVDYLGHEEMYGYFHVGKAFGETNPPALIDWAQVRGQAQARIDQAGMTVRGDLVQPLHQGRSSVVTAADFLVEEEGMYRVTYEDLLKAGLDLAGANPYTIAVTVAGQPVPRSIETPSRRRHTTSRAGSRPSMFGPGSSILFWGDLPRFPEAKYIDHQVYRVAQNPDAVLTAAAHSGHVSRPGSQQRVSRTVSDQVGYHFSNPNPDPWYMRRLRSWGSNHRSHSVSFDVPASFDRFGEAEVMVRLAGLTSLPDTVTHRIAVFLNGQEIADEAFVGQVPHQIRTRLRGAQLVPGENEVEVRSVGIAGINSITLLDAVELAWTELNLAVDNRILFEPRAAGAGVIVSGLDTTAPVHAFARTERGLVQLAAEAFGRGQVVAALPDDANRMRVWMSGRDELLKPTALGPVHANGLLDGLGELVIIAHPAFLPMNERETHPLNDFVQRRRAQGWTVSVRSVADIQLHFGGGMPLPGAVNAFLAAASEVNDVSHVLLVGSDSYDYRDHLGLGSISFIPTHYAPTYFVNFTPSDALLADITGDGMSDLAIGRWPVRTQADLVATVQKVIDWETNMMGDSSAVWVTDLQDPRTASFARQAERMASLLVEQGGWGLPDFDRISFEDYGSPAAMRSDLFDALASGRALTGFTGHGSPTLWSFQGVLVPSHVAELDNEGFPTLVSTSACYTTYFTSPHANTLAHRLMNGMRLDGSGNAVPASNGAVAVHGAATLSNLAHNEVFVREVLTQQLNGATLGEAVLSARQTAAARGISDLVINWTLLGDPTLRLQ